MSTAKQALAFTHGMCTRPGHTVHAAFLLYMYIRADSYKVIRCYRVSGCDEVLHLCNMVLQYSVHMNTRECMHTHTCTHTHTHTTHTHTQHTHTHTQHTHTHTHTTHTHTHTHTHTYTHTHTHTHTHTPVHCGIIMLSTRLLPLLF